MLKCCGPSGSLGFMYYWGKQYHQGVVWFLPFGLSNLNERRQKGETTIVHLNNAIFAVHMLTI